MMKHLSTSNCLVNQQILCSLNHAKVYYMNHHTMLPLNPTMVCYMNHHTLLPLNQTELKLCNWKIQLLLYHSIITVNNSVISCHMPTRNRLLPICTHTRSSLLCTMHTKEPCWRSTFYYASHMLTLTRATVRILGPLKWFALSCTSPLMESCSFLG